MLQIIVVPSSCFFKIILLCWSCNIQNDYSTCVYAVVDVEKQRFVCQREFNDLLDVLTLDLYGICASVHYAEEIATNSGREIVQKFVVLECVAGFR